MNSVVDIIQKVVTEQLPPLEGAVMIRNYISSSLNQREKSRSSCAYRMCRSLHEISRGHGSWSDFAGHARQFILMFNHRLSMSNEIIQGIHNLTQDFGLIIESSNEVNAEDIYPSWFDNPKFLNPLYNLELRRPEKPVLGDGIICEMTGNTHYISNHQKQIIRASMNLKPGHTLLACLPTGGGKSLVGQMPAFFETEGGTISGNVETAGTTLVIVPTVALALDQVRASRCYFRNITDEEHGPQAYYGGMPNEQKKSIYNGLKNGTIPLLYTSPEAILNGPFYNILLESARLGRLNRLIIDEAHMVVDWGSSFRTDFQLLAGFRRRLLEESSGRVKTVLLSATITDRAVETLKELFAETDNYVEIRCDSLRAEPMFWFDKSPDEQTRREKILEILPLLPRPIIMYVTSPDRAIEWESAIKSLQFTSMAVFSGKTSNNDRHDIINKWNNDEIDIIVATSAFGMGVDKRDVRTVIHCCMPESLNRFYQEVGRTGRDGYPSISILSVLPQVDYDEAFNLIKSTVLTPENIVDRWVTMRNEPVEQVQGDMFWLNTGCVPPHLRGQKTGQRNADFNEVALLFLYRLGFVDIIDIRPGNIENRRHILVKLKNLDTLENIDLLTNEITPLRTVEWEEISKELQKIRNLARSPVSQCWSKFFNEVYSYTLRECGGCPRCRKDGLIPFNSHRVCTVYGEHHLLFHENSLSGKLFTYLGSNHELFLYLSNYAVAIDQLQIINFCKYLVMSGVKNIFLPGVEDSKLGEALGIMPHVNCSPYSLFEAKEFISGNENIFVRGLIALFYPHTPEECNKFYAWSQDYLERHPDNQVIHLAPKELLILSQDKSLYELVDGLNVNADNVLVDNSEMYKWI